MMGGTGRWLGTGAVLFAAIALGACAAPDRVGPVPDEVRARFGLDPFYEKHVDVGGLPVVGSGRVSDYAMAEAAFLVRTMLAQRDDIRDAMAAQGVRVVVMAYDEFTTDVPEHSDLRPAEYWDRRARGLGATPERPAVSCAEENLLRYPGDPYSTECILIHEFAHAMHQMGLNTAEPRFDARLAEAYDAAMAGGLWTDKYAASNRFEYWAEGVQSWFDTNRENDNDHNHVNTREELIEYDPRLGALVEEVYGNSWRFVHPHERLTGHLRGYDPGAAPRFVWKQGLPENVPRFLGGD